MERWDSRVKGDHEALEAQVGALKMALTIEGTAEDRQVTLRKFIRAIGPDLDLHLKKEEEVLFPALQRLGEEKAGSITLLKEQHGQLRRILRQLAGLVCECSGSETLDWKIVAQTGQQFIELLEDHERKEEQLVINVLNSSLKPQELMQLAQGFQKAAWAAFREGL